MGICGTFIVFVIIPIVWYLYKRLCKLFAPLPLPKLETEKYWGPGIVGDYVEDKTINEFKVAYEDVTIAKLKEKLGDDDFITEPLEGVGFEYGFNGNKLKEIVKFWKDDYLPRWKSRENLLNQFKQFTTSVNGLKIHYLHVKPVQNEFTKSKKVFPLLILHGWPGSIREFYDIIPKLTTPTEKCEFVFEVIAPSLPGYGWSQGASKIGFGPSEKAIVLRNLMLRIGFEKFIVQGGDWGSVIGNRIATIFPQNVIAYHSNMAMVSTHLSKLKQIVAAWFPNRFVRKEFQHFHYPMMKKLIGVFILESGYFHIQATKPDTIGNAVAASPIGLAAYILEKFSTGVSIENTKKKDGGLDSTFSMDALLDNVMIYYLTKSFTTSVRFYSEACRTRERELQMDRIQSPVKMGCLRFKHDLHAELDWVLKDKYPNLVHSTYQANGGHFAAMEVPEVFYNDFIEFVKKL